MIKSLYIKNFILIDELYLEFEKGINVFTGETGAGKTIIMYAIDVALGAKINKGVLKDGNMNALIDVVFENDGKEIIVSREISKTGTKPRVNGVLVTIEDIKELREKLIDIHTQHQSYTYIAPKYHLELLDSYISKENGDFLLKLSEYKKNFLEYEDLRKKIETLKQNNEQSIRQIEFLKFQIKEIEDAEVYENEENKLKDELEILSNMQNLKEVSYSSYWSLSGEDNNICEVLSKIQSNISKHANLDKNLEKFESTLINVTEELRDCATELRNYCDNLQDEPERLDEINERLSIIEKLKRKYGEDLESVLFRFKDELKNLENDDNNLDILSDKEKSLENILNTLSFEISTLRKDRAGVLSSLIEKELEKLELKNSKFKIDIKNTAFTKDGIDKVEFLITTNISQELMPLAKVASGGEISRVMLAIKTVFANIDKIKTIIFDEIDAGISGKTSQSVAGALLELSKNCQLLIITHQAIIASCANSHYHVSKTQENETKIFVEKLDNKKRVRVIAQIASGEVSEKSLALAQELLSSCFNIL